MNAGIGRRPWIAAGLAAALRPSAAAEPGVTADRITIGQTITLQGGRNIYGAAVVAGMRLRLDAVNAGGGIAGRRLALRTLDDDNSNAKAAALARQLVGEGVFLLFGSIEGGPSTAVAQVAAELAVPFFGPLAGSPTLRRPHQPMVFPVRAEHRDEFRALMSWGQRTGLATIGFFHADSPTGAQHLENVRLLAGELGMKLVLPMPFKPDVSDEQLDALARELQAKAVDLVFNHGSIGIYARLIQRTRALGAKATFMAVNSGSSQLAAMLGPLAAGMVFAQVVPSPWEGKHAIAREFRAAAQAADPVVEPSYGALEGYLTMAALVQVLRAAGRELTRGGFVRTAERSAFDLGGVNVRWTAGDHAGSRFVDLAMVTREGRFIH